MEKMLDIRPTRADNSQAVKNAACNGIGFLAHRWLHDFTPCVKKSCVYTNGVVWSPSSKRWEPTVSDTDLITFTRARLRIVSIAAEATGLPGLTPIDREQMRTIAGLAALHLHRVSGPAEDTDWLAADDDLKQIRKVFQGLVGQLCRSVEFGLTDDGEPGSARANGAAWQADSDRGEWS
jgi:hypothetical protein